MADLTVVASNVSPLQGAILRDFTAGGAGALGDCVYLAADGDVEVADGGAAGTANGKGIVVAIGTGKATFAAGDRLTVAVYGPVAGFSGLTPDDVAYVSDTAGALADAAGTVSHKMGWVESATVVFINPAVA